MSEIKIIAMREDQADSAAAMLPPEVCDALKNGLPVAAFAAAIEDRVVGTTAGVVEGDVFEIDSIFVNPMYRRQGVGRALIEKVSEYTDEMGLGLKAEYTLVNEDAKTLEPFFEALDFIEDPVEYPVYCIGRLENLSINVRGSQNMYKGIMSFLEAPERMLAAANTRSIRVGWPIPNGGLMSDRMDKELSFCSVAGGRIKAYIAVEPVSDELIRITAMWSELNDPRELMVLLAKTVEGLKRRFARDARIAMLALNPISYKIIEHVCDGAESCSFRFIRKY